MNIRPKRRRHNGMLTRDLFQEADALERWKRGPRAARRMVERLGISWGHAPALVEIHGLGGGDGAQ